MSGLNNCHGRSPLGAFLRSELGDFSSAFNMPWVFTSFASAYQGAGGDADYDTDYARWMSILNNNTIPSIMHFSQGNRLRYYKVCRCIPFPFPGGYAGDPWFNVPIPKFNDWFANARTESQGFGFSAFPIDLDQFIARFIYPTAITEKIDPTPKHVTFYIQSAGEMVRTDLEPGIDDFQDWLDSRSIPWTEETSASCRWLQWLCDFIETY